MARMLEKISQEMLGRKLGITFQQVQKYEKGVNRIGASRMLAIATAVSRPVGWFFEGVPGEGTPKRLVENPLDEFGTTADGLALARAFNRIGDRDARAAVLTTAEAFAGRPAPVKRKEAA
jgi:transcriptional regulator with XRE-family HTH domain